MWNFLRPRRRAAVQEREQRGAPRHLATDVSQRTTADQLGAADTGQGELTAATGHDPRTRGTGAGSHQGVEVAVQHRVGPASAHVAPEQDEDDLPRERVDATLTSRADRVGEALDRWSQQIAGTTRGTSFLTHMRAGDHVLDLTHSHPSGLAQLLAGRGATRLSSLVREVGALADARAHARAIRETAERQAEEVGLTTCHLGIGEATWIPADGSEPLQAPVLVRPLTLRLRGNAREDVDLDVDATVDLNPVLLRALREAGVAVDARALLSTTDGAYGFDPNPVLDAFRALGQPLPGFRISHALVVGNMMDAAGAMVDDLDSDRAQWVSHPLVAALAGDPEARRELNRSTGADGSADDASERVPESELVAAIEPDRHRALEEVLSGAHLAVTTPPGADALDMVMDLAAELNARGRSVLVVSQRRRNLSQLVDDAAQRGLSELVFDLSPDPSLQRNASAALLQSLRRAGSFHPPVSVEESAELTRTREILGGHVEAMHRVQQPWNASAHESISALAALTRLRPAPRTAVRLRSDVAARMVGEERAAFVAALREAARAGLLSTHPEDTAWFGATISSDTQAARALELVTELREQLLPRLRVAAEATGASIGLQDATTLTDLLDRLALLQRVRGVISVFQPAAFGAPLEDMIAATADKQWRLEHGVALGWGTRRALRKQAASLQRPASLAPDLHAALGEVRLVRDRWRRVSREPTRTPSVPKSLDANIRLADRMQQVCDELAVLLRGTPDGGDLSTCPVDALGERAERLWADRGDLEHLPQRTTLQRRLDFDGLGELVADLRERRVGPAGVAAELDLAWWRSVLELIAAAEPTISQYDGTSLSQVAERFRRLDAEQLANSAHRVRAASDEALVRTMKTFPDTSRAAIAELARSSTVSVRDLAAKYEDILFRARPTWLASPFLVPQIVPRGQHFDVVIVADGGRLPTAAALGAIGRARQTVVIGDPLEYPGDGDRVLLDDMLAVAAHRPLRRDRRPAAEGLRAFAQRRSVCPEVLAVPSPAPRDPDRLVRVEDGRGPVTEGMEYVESTEAELRRVTDLVIEHARTRPERSLAVLTFTDEHARRVMERVMQTVSVISELRRFFDPAGTEFFTVLPAVHATGVVRDDIIVSVGFGKTPHGRLLHRFGPLSGPAGRKALTSVITRARGRTTVVSSIDADDLDPIRLRTDGARDLRSVLRVLSGLPDDPESAAADGSDDEAPTAEGTSAAEGASAADEPVAEDTDLDAAIEAALQEGAGGAHDAAPVAESSSVSAAVAAATPEAWASDGMYTERTDHATTDDARRVDVWGRDVGTPPEPADAAAAATSAEAPQLETDALLRDLADRLWRLGLSVESDFGLTEDRIELALGHPDLPGRYLLAVETDGERYVGTPSQRERDRLRAERLEAAGWSTERVWSWALFIDPDGEAERIRRAVERALALVRAEGERSANEGIGTIRPQLPRPQIPAGHPLSFYSSEDFDQVVEYICSDGRARLEEQLGAEVRAFLGFEQRSVLLDVSVSSAIRRYQERQ